MSYDYCVSYPQTPAFDANIISMFDKIQADGESPTIYHKSAKPTYDGEGNVIDPGFEGSQSRPMKGTKPANGKTLIHFRLPQRLTEAELLVYLKEDMIAPLPPLSVEYIVSRDNIIEVDNGDPEMPNTFIQEVIKAPNKAIFLPFIGDIKDGEDGNGDPIMRPPNMGDDLFLSHYFGVEPLKL